MGWDSCTSWNTKKDVINEIVDGYKKEPRYRILGQKSTSKAFYLGLEVTNDNGTLETFIAVYLIQRRGKDIMRKGMSERSGPVVCDCPLDLLETVPCPDSEYAREWRKRVIAFHESKGKGKSLVSSLKQGDVFDLYDKTFVFEQFIDGKKSIKACVEGTFQFFKISPKHFQFIQLVKGAKS